MVETTQSINAHQQTEKQADFLPKFKFVLGPDGIRRAVFLFAIGEYYNLTDPFGCTYPDLTESAIREINILVPFYKATGYGVNLFWHPSTNLLKGLMDALYRMDLKERHQVEIYFTGHGVMQNGKTCMVIPHTKAEADEKKPWDDRDNIYKLEFYIFSLLKGKKNLKVVTYFDCCRVVYVSKCAVEPVGMDDFAGNIYVIFGCNTAAKVFVKLNSACFAN